MIEKSFTSITADYFGGTLPGMPGSREFWGRLGEARESALSGEIPLAASLLEELRDNYPTGDENIDGKRIALLETIARTCGIPFSGQRARGANGMAGPVRAVPPGGAGLRALPGAVVSGKIVVDWSSDMPVREESYQDSKAIVVNHSALAEPCAVGGAGIEAGVLFPALDRAQKMVEAQRRAEALVAYERYLDLISGRTGDPALIGRATLLDGTRFEAALRHDPSQPFTLLGAGLSRLRHGDVARGRHLLRRLASSGYPERRQAQRFLRRLVSAEVGA